MITRHRPDNEDAFINQLIMETPRKNGNKDEFVYLIQDRLIQNKGHRDVTGVSKILRKFKGDDGFSRMCCVYLDRVSKQYTQCLMCIFV